MWAYIVRRIFWTIPIVFGILLITFLLFRVVTPDPAYTQLGKHKTQAQLIKLREEMGLNKPRWFNVDALKKGDVRGGFNSQFFDILLWRFPDSQHYHESLGTIFARKAPASAAIMFPIFFIELGIQLVLAIVCAFNRGRWPDTLITFLAIFGLCIPGLSLIILAQAFFGFMTGLFPVAGWDTGIRVWHFAALPILVGVISGLGGAVRFYRTVFVEEVYTDYVRTARAKGVSNREILFTHVLKNAMIPVITQTITSLPFLILGSLLLERMFQVPGLGNLLVEALGNSDQPILIGMTYGISVVYCLMLLVNDICYTLVDPRVRLT